MYDSAATNCLTANNKANNNNVTFIFYVPSSMDNTPHDDRRLMQIRKPAFGLEQAGYFIYRD